MLFSAWRTTTYSVLRTRSPPSSQSPTLKPTTRSQSSADKSWDKKCWAKQNKPKTKFSVLKLPQYQAVSSKASQRPAILSARKSTASTLTSRVSQPRHSREHPSTRYTAPSSRRKTCRKADLSQRSYLWAFLSLQQYSSCNDLVYTNQ